MKSLGICRRIDDLGRVTLPIELRKTLKISIKDSLEIFTEKDQIILKKYNPGGCNECGETENLIQLDKVKLCPDCVRKVAQIVGFIK